MYNNKDDYVDGTSLYCYYQTQYIYDKEKVHISNCDFYVSHCQ